VDILKCRKTCQVGGGTGKGFFFHEWGLLSDVFFFLEFIYVSVYVRNGMVMFDALLVSYRALFRFFHDLFICSGWEEPKLVG